MLGADENPAHRLIVGYTSDISRNGSHHRIVAEIVWAAGKLFVYRADHVQHCEVSSEPTRKYVVVYVGSDTAAACNAEMLVHSLYTRREKAPEDWPPTLTP